MSGFEVIGVVSGIIATLDAVAKLSNAIKDSSGLPTAFRDVHQRLPLVALILKELGRTEQADLHPDAWTAMSPTVESCQSKAKRLELIFNEILPQPLDLRLDRYWKAVRALGKGDTVESLMDGILADCQLLIGLRSIRASSRDRDSGCSGGSCSGSGSGSGGGLKYASNFNTGGGTQYIYTGVGTQVNCLGSGPQFNGPVTQYY